VFSQATPAEEGEKHGIRSINHRHDQTFGQ
jgi:hypothetical protein